MLVFATSDKGGTGRSVTGCNLAYRCALQGKNVCYLDFDFGSPTAGAIFEIQSVLTGTERNGLHSLLVGRATDPVRLDVWTESDRNILRAKPLTAGDLVLFPGDRGGGEFSVSPSVTERCVDLFNKLDEEFDICFVDLSAGRSYATDIALQATARDELRNATTRWLVFHRWTRQHIIAAAELVHGDSGLVEAGVQHGHKREALVDSIRFVRTAIIDPDSPKLVQMPPPQAAWLREFHGELQQLAATMKLGRTVLLGETPMDPVLQWREQLISDRDVHNKQIANQETVSALVELARRLTDEAAWEGV
ncbi:DNA-binding protein [Kibdelosporangium aridum]|uniref:DNA-binding protein n=1 Tax=Kibdelosporangium aridum TaxID=2030 RepID=A0A428Z9Q3_KIBAR|nr:SCO2523 family variant P-loop protein [Kibdelosporangium aridum]RSM84730.1 DNA-binding protein [Kibdelosporangium aridum]